MDPKTERVVAAAAARGLKIEPTRFPDETRTAEDAARAVGCEVGQIVKSLVFESSGEPILFLVSGANRLDPDRAARAAGIDRLERADANGVKSATGFSIGATPPFGHVHEIPVFMDEDLLDYEMVWAAAGRPDSVFEVTPEALAAAAGATVIGLKEA